MHPWTAGAAGRVPGLGARARRQLRAVAHAGHDRDAPRRGARAALARRRPRRRHGQRPPVGGHGPQRRARARGSSRATPRAASRGWSTSTTATVAVLRATQARARRHGAAAGPRRRAGVRRHRGRAPQPGARLPAVRPRRRRCRTALGADALPAIRLHDLRHTHATILLPARRAGARRSASGSATPAPVVTMTVYAHVLPGSQREAADLFARLIKEAKW